MILLIYIYHFIFSEHVDIDEAKSIFESNYSHVYFILYDTLVQAETNLRQRGKFDVDNFSIVHLLRPNPVGVINLYLKWFLVVFIGVCFFSLDHMIMHFIYYKTPHNSNKRQERQNKQNNSNEGKK